MEQVPGKTYPRLKIWLLVGYVTNSSSYTNQRTCRWIKVRKAVACFGRRHIPIQPQTQFQREIGTYFVAIHCKKAQSIDGNAAGAAPLCHYKLAGITRLKSRKPAEGESGPIH